MGSFYSKSSEHYSESNTRFAYGHVPDTYNMNDLKFHMKKHVREATLPNSCSLESQFPPAMNQGVLHSSTACAIASVIQYIQTKSDRNHKVDPSVMYLYYLGRHPSQTMLNIGTSLQKTFTLMNKYGIKDEKQFRYIEDCFTMKPDLHDRTHHFQGLFEPRKVKQDLKTFQLCLSVYEKPILFGFNIYESFLRVLDWDNDGKMPLPKEHEKLLGSQTGVCVGFSEKKQAFLIRNSWGEQWKNNGYFLMPYDYFCGENCCDFWTLDLISDIEFDGFEQPTKRRKKKHSKRKDKEREKEKEKEMVIPLESKFMIKPE